MRPIQVIIGALVVIAIGVFAWQTYMNENPAYKRNFDRGVSSGEKGRPIKVTGAKEAKAEAKSKVDAKAEAAAAAPAPAEGATADGAAAAKPAEAKPAAVPPADAKPAEGK